jgi:hypothetical protein
MVFTRDERRLLTTTNKADEVAVWRVPTLTLEHILTLPHHSQQAASDTDSTQLAIDADGHALIARTLAAAL